METQACHWPSETKILRRHLNVCPVFEYAMDGNWYGTEGTVFVEHGRWTLSRRPDTPVAIMTMASSEAAVNVKAVS